MSVMKGQCCWVVEGTNPTGVKCQCGKPTGFVMVVDGDQVLRRKYPAFCAQHQIDAVTAAENAIETGSTRK